MEIETMNANRNSNTTTFSRQRIGAFILAIASAAAVSVSGASADTPFTFKYKAHELETDGGREILISRLEAQAESFCSARTRRGSALSEKTKKCVQEKTGEIIAQIDDNRLDNDFTVIAQNSN